MADFQYYEVPNHAAVYNKFRPSTPQDIAQKIISYLKQETVDLNVAVDIGCGSGQSTEVLAPYFEKVIGIDPSEKQIVEAKEKNKISNINYRVGTAENIPCQPSTVQLVTAGQACHWFDMKKFYTEAERVLSPGGVLAIYGYLLPRPQYQNKSKQLCDIVDKYYNTILGDYVLPESKKVYIDNYRGNDFMQFPFAKDPLVRDESVTAEHRASVVDLVGYVSSWSAFQNYTRIEGKEKAGNLLNKFENDVMKEIGATATSNEAEITIAYQYFLIMGRKPCT